MQPAQAGHINRTKRTARCAWSEFAGMCTEEEGAEDPPTDPRHRCRNKEQLARGHLRQVQSPTAEPTKTGREHSKRLPRYWSKAASRAFESACQGPKRKGGPQRPPTARLKSASIWGLSGESVDERAKLCRLRPHCSSVLLAGDVTKKNSSRRCFVVSK